MKATVLFLVCLPPLITWGQGQTVDSSPIRVVTNQEASVVAGYGHLPLAFEAHQSQTDDQVRFVSRAAGVAISLTPTSAVMRLRRSSRALPVSAGRTSASRTPEEIRLLTTSSMRADRSVNESAALVRMRLVGANSQAAMSGMYKLRGKVNYFIGKDPKKWVTKIPTYRKVRSNNVYTGVDLVFYGNNRHLEYDFIVAPNGHPDVIRLSVDVEDSGKKPEPARLDSNGDLVLATNAGEIRFCKPVAYQLGTRGKHFIDAHYALRDGNEIGFEVAAYNRNRPLIIDPVLFYSTYLGGTAEDHATAIAVDKSGNAYVTGFTYSTDFPTVNAFQGVNQGAPDVFVAKLNAAGSALLYSTYIGGSAEDVGNAIAVDGSGNAYVTGYSNSTDFPTVNAIQGTNHGGNDAFVLQLNTTGSALVYSTYLGGTGDDQGRGIRFDGRVYVAGHTSSTDFPIVNALQTTNHGGYDLFVAELTTDGFALDYSTYLGGSSDDFANGVAVVDRSLFVRITGRTLSTDFPTTAGALQKTNHGGAADAFVVVLADKCFSPCGEYLWSSTYLGGSGDDSGEAIAITHGYNSYVVGYTNSADFPGQHAAIHGGYDGFWAEVSWNGKSGSSEYLGGSGDDFATGIALNLNSYLDVAVTGYTYSTDFPTNSPIQATNHGGADAFVMDLYSWSTYLGGSSDDFATGVAVDASGHAYVTGYTASTDFPMSGPIQSTNQGSDDVFVSKLVRAADLQITNSAPATVSSGSTLTYTIVATNLGPDSTSVTVKDTIPPGTTFNAVSAGCKPPSGSTGTVVCLFSNGSSQPVTLTVNVTAPAGSKIADTASVSSSLFDPNTKNNHAKVVTSVQ